MKLSDDLRTELRLFAFYLANSSLCDEVLEGIDYKTLMAEPSALEQVFAIFANVIELDDNGKVTNVSQVHKRAAQYIRRFFDRTYVVQPPFEDRETRL